MPDFSKNNEDITELAQRWIMELKVNRHVENTNTAAMSLDTHSQVHKFQDNEPHLMGCGK